MSAIHKCKISEDDVENVINLLCDRTFIGKEVSLNDFRFQYNIEDYNKIDVMSRKFAESKLDKQFRYRIYPAFQSYSEITS